jgi:hypothetical protein
MKIFLVELSEVETIALLREGAARSTLHTLVERPEEAGLILFIGQDSRVAGRLLDHPVYRQFPSISSVYTEEDSYLPLIPGVYCSARVEESSRIGRAFNYSYMSRNGRHRNPFLSEEASAERNALGAPETPKKFLFSFQGASTSFARKRLFKLKLSRPDVLIENTSSFLNWDNSQSDRTERQRRYAETIFSSHFVLCPRGAGSGSIRLFEVMAAGIAPVLISDEYALPPDVDWDSFLLRCRERDLRNLPQFLEAHLSEAKERGRLAREAYLEHFQQSVEFERVIELAIRAQRHSGPSEEVFRKKQGAMVASYEGRAKMRKMMRDFALKVMRRLPFSPYQVSGHG